MSDLMLLGVLRMPVTPDSDHLTLKQYIDRGRQAADLIEQLQQRVVELEKKNLSTLRDLGESHGKWHEYQQRCNQLAATVERLRDFADKVENWNECTTDFRVNFGAKGERDYYRNLAREALAAAPQVNLNAIKREALIQLAEHMTPEHGISHLCGGGDVWDYANNKYPSVKDGEQ